MLLDTLPLLIVFVGLVLYTVLAGADFGAGLWQLVVGRGEHGRRIRDHAHHANAPVWEANHVWLILVLTVMWTAYPQVVGSICSTLAVPIFLAAIGIVFRGLCYTLQSATHVAKERRFIDTAFAVSSILTPFMLGTAVGGIASGRVPVGNAKGDLLTSWVNPTSIVTGCLAVAVGGYLAAVYLAGDARRLDRDVSHDLADSFRTRALVSGVIAGALSIADLVVVHGDAPHLFDGLTGGWGIAAVIVSAVAGAWSLVLLLGRRFETSRVGAAVAVAALIGGWAAAQRPHLLPGLTLQAAAADRATMVAIVISVVAGGVILAPSLALLFRLSLGGQLDPDPNSERRLIVTAPDARRPDWAGRVGLACFVVGLVLLTVADAAVAHVFGVVALAAAGVLVYTAIGPDALAAREPDAETPRRRRRAG